MAVQISGNDITVPRDGSFTRNVTIGGTLTYEDVTNIDSVGLVTARNGIEIGARPGVAASISVDGNMIVSGISTFGGAANFAAISGTTGTFTGDVDIADSIVHTGDNSKIRFPSNDVISFETSGSEGARLDAGRRFLIGSTTARTSGGGAYAHLQVEGTDSPGAEILVIRNSNDTYASTLGLVKTRGTSDGAVTTVADNDKLGQIQFRGADGSDIYSVAASIHGEVDGSPSDGTDMPGALVFGTTADAAASPTERLRITSEGKIGITESSPANYGIHASQSSQSVYYRADSGSVDSIYGSATSLGLAIAGTTSNHPFVLYANNAERLRITSGGAMGLGIDAPVAQLQVNSTKNAETDRHDGSNYHLFLRNPEDDTGEACGLAFAITSNATKTGAAIMHEREGGGSQGNLQFYTNSDGNSVTEQLRINANGTIRYGTSFGSDTDGKIITLNSATHLCKTFLISGNYTMSSTLSKSSANSHPGTLEVRNDTDGPAIICGQLGRSNTAGAYSGLNISLEYPKLGLYAASVGGSYGSADFVISNNSAPNSSMATLSNEVFRIYTGGKIRSAYTYSGTTTGGGPIYVESDGDFLRYTSSRKYKTDIETLEDARADNILNCRPVWYKSLSENDIKTPGADKSDWGWYGFIAEEVAEIEPRLVNWATKDAKPEGVNGSVISVERDPSNYEAEGVRYDNFVPLLVNLVKRQKAEIESLKARLDAAGL